MLDIPTLQFFQFQISISILAFCSIMAAGVETEDEAVSIEDIKEKIKDILIATAADLAAKPKDWFQINQKSSWDIS